MRKKTIKETEMSNIKSNLNFDLSDHEDSKTRVNKRKEKIFLNLT